MLGSVMTYAIVYVFVVGIISYYPGFAPLKVTSPIVAANSLGIMIIPGNYIFIFAFYSAIVFLTVSSLLVGLIVALIAYSRDLSNRYGHCKVSTIKSNGILATIPAFFTSFSCCGGGLLPFVIGPVAFSSLAIYGNYMALLTIAALAAGTLSMLTRTNQLKQTIIMDGQWTVQMTRGV